MPSQIILTDVPQSLSHLAKDENNSCDMLAVGILHELDV